MFNSNLARKQKTQINVTDGSTVEARWGEPGCVRHRQTHTQTHGLKTKCRLHTDTHTQFENCRIVLTSENSQPRARLCLDPAGLPREWAPLQADPRFRPHGPAHLPSLLSSLAPIPPPQRKRKCLACIKLDSKDQVLGRMVHCPIQTPVQRVRRGLVRWGETRPWERPGWRGAGAEEELWAWPRRPLGRGRGRWVLAGMVRLEWPCARRSWRRPRTPNAAGWSMPARTPTATTFPDSSPSSKPCPPELRPGG